MGRTMDEGALLSVLWSGKGYNGYTSSHEEKKGIVFSFVGNVVSCDKHDHLGDWFMLQWPPSVFSTQAVSCWSNSVLQSNILGECNKTVPFNKTTSEQFPTASRV